MVPRPASYGEPISDGDDAPFTWTPAKMLSGPLPVLQAQATSRCSQRAEVKNLLSGMGEVVHGP